ncbi:ragulator complex protein LAMTOR1-like [Gigantopelta aegis]|uniref:ragulator complex protein LAMTOR1-like n=1 Tax=Gigantopelta aegis TaxID=1735272 RepID=UPI001B8892A7|nr:ragulator complex protein LAMTOR1-like [Gigantopelta aegis]
MGCCFSNDDEKDLGVSSPNERTPLLDPARTDHIQPVPGHTHGSPYEQPGKKGDDQSALNRSLHQMARDVVDVTSDSQPLEQPEYHDRARQYSNRLNMVLSGSGRSRIHRPSLPNGTTVPHQVLSAPPVSLTDVQLITSVTEKVAKAMKDVKVQHREDLVVPFGVP